jgi:hypothetical protein
LSGSHYSKHCDLFFFMATLRLNFFFQLDLNKIFKMSTEDFNYKTIHFFLNTRIHVLDCYNNFETSNSFKTICCLYFIIKQNVVFKKKRTTKNCLPTYPPTVINMSRVTAITQFFKDRASWPQERNTSIFLMHFIYF